MSYVMWSVIAMATYGLTSVLLKLAFRGGISASVALILANLAVVGAGIIWFFVQGASVKSGLGFNRPTLFLAVAAVVLGFAIFGYYRALSLGPASVVVPIFAMSFTVAAILGFVVLGEPFKATRAVGLALAAAAIVLLTR